MDSRTHSATQPATWQSLKRHANLLPLRPHPSYFLSYRPLHHGQQTAPPPPQPPSPSGQGPHGGDAVTFSHVPLGAGSPRGAPGEGPASRTTTITTPFRRPAIISQRHRSRASVVDDDDPGRSVRADDLQCDLRRGYRRSATVARTDPSFVRGVRASGIAKVSSDFLLLKSHAGFQAERSVLGRCRSLSDLREKEESSLFHSRQPRAVTRMSCSNQPADRCAAKRQDSCIYRTQFANLSGDPLARTAPEQIYMNEPCMTRICLQTSRESTAAKAYKTELHSTSPQVRAIYPAKTAEMDGTTQRVFNTHFHALLDSDGINRTFDHPNGHDTDASSSSSAPAHIPDKTFVTEKQQKPAARKMAVTSLEHTSPSHSGGMRPTRIESRTSASSPSHDIALFLQPPPLTRALTLDTANVSSVYGANMSSSYMSKRPPDLPTSSLKREETGLLTMIDDSRKRRPCSGIQSGREEREDHALQSQKEVPGEESIAETSYQSTKRPKIAGFHINNLNACESELEQICHTQAQHEHHYGEKPSLCEHEHPETDLQLEVKVDVVSVSQPETEQRIPRANGENVLSMDTERDDTHRRSIANDGLCQVSRQIRSAIMKESYEVSQMTHSVREDKQCRLAVDVCSKDQSSRGEKYLRSEYSVVDNSIPQPIALFVNNSKKRDLVFSEWDAYRAICNTECQKCKHTMSQCYSALERQHYPHPFVQNTETPALLAFQMFLRNPVHASLISSCDHFHKPGALQRVRQDLRLQDLLADNHTSEQGSPPGHTATLCGQPSGQRGCPALKPDMDIRRDKLSDQQASHMSPGVPSSPPGRVEKRQWTPNGPYDRQETMSFHSKSLHSSPPQTRGAVDSELHHTQPQGSDFTRYCSPASTRYCPTSQTYSARGGSGSEANGPLNTLPCLEPSVTGSRQSGKLRCSVSHQNTGPPGYPGFLWPFRPIPRYPCSQRRDSVLCHLQNIMHPSCRPGAPSFGNGSEPMGAAIR